jgi:hypothetical protein
MATRGMDDATQGGCPACTHVNSAGSAFCNACGSRLHPQPASVSANPPGPRSYFRAPLVPEDVRNALGTFRWPMPPTHSNESEIDGTTTGREFGAFTDTERELCRLRAARAFSGANSALESRLERVTIPTFPSRPPASDERPIAHELPACHQIRDFAQSSLPQTSPDPKHRDDSVRTTVTKALSCAALIGLLAVGATIVADRGRQASAQADNRSAAGQLPSGHGTTAGVTELAPADQTREIRYPLNALSETPQANSSESPATAGVPNGQPIDDERRRESVSDSAPEPLDPSVGLVPPRASNADSPTDSVISLTESPSRRSSISGPIPANAAIATQQNRQLRTRRVDAPHQKPKQCSMEQHVLGLCTKAP